MNRSIASLRLQDVAAVGVSVCLATILGMLFLKITMAYGVEPSTDHFKSVTRETVRTGETALSLLGVALFVASASIAISGVRHSRLSLPQPSIPTIDTPYPITTVGVRHRVDTTEFQTLSHGAGGERCVVCESDLVVERREWRKQYVLFGIPVLTDDWGTNCYCAECRDPFSVEAIAQGPEVALAEVDG